MRRHVAQRPPPLCTATAEHVRARTLAELEAERVLAGLLVDALLIKEQLNDVSTPVVERNLSQLPELKDVVTLRRVVDIFGR